MRYCAFKKLAVDKCVLNSNILQYGYFIVILNKNVKSYKYWTVLYINTPKRYDTHIRRKTNWSGDGRSDTKWRHVISNCITAQMKLFKCLMRNDKTTMHGLRWRTVMRSRSWWRHQMDIFSALLAICAGNSPVTGEFPSQRPVTRSFDFSLICAWIKDWVNNRETGD